jgi:hypothetical protein
MPAGACAVCGNALGSDDHKEACGDAAEPRRPRRRLRVPAATPATTAELAGMGAELLRQLKERQQK